MKNKKSISIFVSDADVILEVEVAIFALSRTSSLALPFSLFCSPYHSLINPVSARKSCVPVGPKLHKIIYLFSSFSVV